MKAWKLPRHTPAVTNQTIWGLLWSTCAVNHDKTLVYNFNQKPFSTSRIAFVTKTFFNSSIKLCRHSSVETTELRKQILDIENYLCKPAILQIIIATHIAL